MSTDSRNEVILILNELTENENYLSGNLFLHFIFFQTCLILKKNEMTLYILLT